jgi:hypothetical protein
MYTDKEIISWARDYVYDDQTLDRLERRTGIPHSTIWWNFHHTLRDLDYDLYDLTMKRIRVNKHSFGRGGVLELGGKVVITSKQDVELPKSLVYQSRAIKKNLIIWRFKTEEDAIRAARLFMSAGFEVVRRPI